MQLNKDILTKEKPNTDLSNIYSFPILSPPSPFSGRAAGTEKNGTEAAMQKILCYVTQ